MEYFDGGTKRTTHCSSLGNRELSATLKQDYTIIMFFRVSRNTEICALELMLGLFGTTVTLKKWTIYSVEAE